MLSVIGTDSVIVVEILSVGDKETVVDEESVRDGFILSVVVAETGTETPSFIVTDKLSTLTT